MGGPWKEFDQTFQTNDSLLKHDITSKLQALHRTYTFMELVTKLKTSVNYILSKITASHEQIFKFTIGKSFVEKGDTSVFDHMNTDTWDKSDSNKGVLGRWTSEYQTGWYTGLVILCAVPGDFLRPKDSTSTTEQAEDRKKTTILTSENYVLALEQQLIHHYAFIEPDPRLGNKSSSTGGLTCHEAGAYVLYLAYQLQSDKDKEDKAKKKKDEEEKKKTAAAMKTTEDKNNKTEGKEDGNPAVEKHEE